MTAPTLWQLAMPEILVTLGALLALSTDIALLRGRSLRQRFAVAGAIGVAGCAASAAWLLHHWATVANFQHGVLLSSPLIAFVQLSLLIFAVLTLWLAQPSKFTNYVGEFCLLVLVATVGMMFLVATQDLLVLFLSLELLSLSLYVLAAWDKSSARGAEAAFKYFMFGGLSAAFLLFGFSLLYGIAGTTCLPDISASVAAHTPDPIALLALVMVVVGLGAKVAVFPLHFWAPDVYEGAPLPGAAFIGAASRVASFFVFYQVMAVGFGGTVFWLPMVAVMAAASMVYGNMAALAQVSFRRLLAYSAIAHAGYVLLALLAPSPRSEAAMVFYLVTYALATMGAFAVAGVVEQQSGSDTLANFAGLWRRSPLLASALAIFLLSLAGVPPLAGFFAKFALFAAALGARHTAGLIVLALATSAVSLYYYLQVLKQALVLPAEGDSALSVPFSTAMLILVLAITVVALGTAPQILLRFLPA